MRGWISGFCGCWCRSRESVIETGKAWSWDLTSHLRSRLCFVHDPVPAIHSGRCACLFNNCEPRHISRCYCPLCATNNESLCGGCRAEGSTTPLSRKSHPRAASHPDDHDIDGTHQDCVTNATHNSFKACCRASGSCTTYTSKCCNHEYTLKMAWCGVLGVNEPAVHQSNPLTSANTREFK